MSVQRFRALGGEGIVAGSLIACCSQEEYELSFCTFCHRKHGGIPMSESGFIALLPLEQHV